MKKTFTKNELIIKQGDLKDKFLYIILKGSCAVKRTTDTGTIIDCGMLREGDIFGEVSMILGTARAATIMAHDNEVVVQQLNKNDFLNLIQKEPNIAWKVLTKLAVRTEMLDEIQDQLSDPKALRKFLLGQ